MYFLGRCIWGGRKQGQKFQAFYAVRNTCIFDSLFTALDLGMLSFSEMSILGINQSGEGGGGGRVGCLCRNRAGWRVQTGKNGLAVR